MQLFKVANHFCNSCLALACLALIYLAICNMLAGCRTKLPNMVSNGHCGIGQIICANDG